MNDNKIRVISEHGIYGTGPWKGLNMTISMIEFPEPIRLCNGDTLVIYVDSSGLSHTVVTRKDKTIENSQ